MEDNTKYYEEMVRNRRELHKRPEEGWTEFETTYFVVEFLKKLGLDVSIGKANINEKEVLGRDPQIVRDGMARALKHGVPQEFLDATEGYTGAVAVLDTGRPGPTTAFRADMDCVLVRETDDPEHLPNKLGFASERPGFMHACGHDAHMSMGLAVCHWLMDNKDKLSGKVKILFQPAEEGVRGAAGMAASGILDDCDYFLSSHVAMLAKSGELATNLYGFLCTTKYDVTFNGRASHAGVSPQEGRNALAAAANATVQMLGISRHGGGMTRINIGQLVAGEGRNVIPSKAVMKLEVRGETMEINNYMSEQVTNIVEGIAKGFSVTYDMRKMGEAVDLTADQELIDILNESGREVGLKVLDKPLNFGGSEDATILARRVQAHGGKAAFFVWGSDRPSGHHSALFDIQEKDMAPAFDLWTHVLPKILK